MDSETLEMYGGFALMVQSKMPDRTHFTSASELVGLFCRIGSNAIYTTDNTMAVTGVALYANPASTLNHSCAPNAVIAFRGRRLALRAAAAIPKGDQVRVAYTDLTLGTPARVAELWKRYQFICRCPRCEWFTKNMSLDAPPPQMSSVGCGACGAEVAFSAADAQPPACARCGERVSNWLTVDGDASALLAVVGDKDAATDALVDAVTRLGAMRHPMYLSAVSAAIEAITPRSEPKVIRDLGTRLIAAYEASFPWHPVLANELFCQAKLCMQLDSDTRAGALAMMQRACLLLEKVYGSDDPTAKESAELVVELQHDIQLEKSMEKPKQARISPY